MPRLIDRYLIREIAPPFLIALVVFTFLLMLPPLVEVAEGLISKGVPAPTIGWIMLTLMPQALGVTIPMAFLVGLLVALGRLSVDREGVALQACGVSMARLLRPVAVLSILGTAATCYTLIVALPGANQTFREITYRPLAARAEDEVSERVFDPSLPGLVLYVMSTCKVPDGRRSSLLTHAVTVPR